MGHCTLLQALKPITGISPHCRHRTLAQTSPPIPGSLVTLRKCPVRLAEIEGGELGWFYQPVQLNCQEEN